MCLRCPPRGACTSCAEGVGEAAAWPGCVERPVRGSGGVPVESWGAGGAAEGPERGHIGIAGFAEKVAHNFPRSFFEHCSKRCNSNDANSRFEEAARELRAILSGNYPHALHRTRPRGMTPVRDHDASSGGLHQLGSITPVGEEYTRKGALHQLGSITPSPKWCNTHLSGVTPLSNKPKCGLARVDRPRSSAASSHTDR